jgi:hypothetical protein
MQPRRRTPLVVADGVLYLGLGSNGGPRGLTLSTTDSGLATKIDDVG